MQPDSYNDRDLPYEYYLVIMHPDEAKVLLAGDGDDWRLPSFVPVERDLRQVGHIIEAAHSLLGIDTFVVRCLRHHYDTRGHRQYRAYLLTTQQGDPEAPEHCRWFDAQEIEGLPTRDDIPMEVVRSSLRESEMGSPDRRVPWAETGWFGEAITWTHNQLQIAGISFVGPVEQLRSWAISCLLRLPTSEGDVYFKAVPPFFGIEPAVMQAASKTHPEIVPTPIAVEVEKGWTLLRDFGGRWLGKVSDVSAWEDSARVFARFQVEHSRNVEFWRELGCPDRGLRTLDGLMDTLFQDAELMMLGAPWGITQDELDQLRSMSLQLKLMRARLADYMVPHTLVHGDLGGNIFVKEEGFVFFDWTDACISHPFFDMTTMVDTVFDEIDPSIGSEGLKARVRDAYLQPWTEFEPMDRLVEAFELSQPLGVLHQIMSYIWIISSVAEDVRWELQDGLVYWLRQLLKARGTT